MIHTRCRHHVYTYILLAVLAALCSQRPVRALGTAEIAPDPDRLIQDHLHVLHDTARSLETRRAAAQLLMDMNRPAATEALVKTLSNLDDRQSQLAVIQALADYHNQPSDKFIKPLLNVLLNSDPKLQLQSPAAAALGRYRSAAVIKRLSKSAADRKLPISTRLAAIEALGNIRAKASAQALIKLLEDPSQEIRSYGTAALQILTGQYIGQDAQAWKKWWAKVRWTKTRQWLARQVDLLARKNRQLTKRLDRTQQTLIDALVRLAPKDQAKRTRIIQLYLASDLPANRRAGMQLIDAILAANQTVPAEIQAALRQLICDPDPAVRKDAATVIAETRDSQAIPQIVKQLDKRIDSPQVRQELLIALGQLGRVQVLPKLLENLQSPLEPVCSGAAKAIEKIFQANNVSEQLHRLSVAALLKRYQQTNRQEVQLRQNLLSTMAAIRDVRFLEIFKQALEDPLRELRYYAARGIADLDDAKHAPLLAAKLNDPDPGVRIVLAGGLAQLTSEPKYVQALLDRSDPNLEQDKHVQQATWKAILTMISRWPMHQQIDWTAQVLTRQSVLTESRYTELLELLLTQLQSPDPKLADQDRCDLSVKLAWLTLEQNRPTEALKQFGQAIGWTAKNDPPGAGVLGARIANRLLEDFENLELLKRFLAQLAGQLDGTQLEPTARLLTDRLRELRQGSDHPAAQKLHQAIHTQFVSALPEHLRIELQSPTSKPAPASKPVSTKPAT